MISISLIIGALIGAGVASLVNLFWDEITGFLQRAVLKIKRLVRGILYGAKIFAKRILGDMILFLSHFYTKLGDVWEETIETKQIPENQVPEDIRRLAREKESEITSKVELQLSMRNA